jgi:type IV secretory pathway VirB6-like protein
VRLETEKAKKVMMMSNMMAKWRACVKDSFKLMRSLLSCHPRWYTFSAPWRSKIKGLLLAAMLLVVTACDVPEGMKACYAHGDWGETQYRKVTVEAKDKLTTSGIRVGQGEPITVTVGGNIDLCPSGTTFSETSNTVYDEDGEATGAVTRPIVASEKRWQKACSTKDSQETCVRVDENERFRIAISGDYQDRKGKQTSGKGLYVYIGDEAPPNDDWWYGESSRSAHENNRMTNTIPEFFELYNNGSSGLGGGFSGIAPKSGYLWFKYARTADARGTDDSGDNRYSPWKGRWAWDAAECIPCVHGVILAACLPALTGTPAVYAACVSAWETGCALSGHLEQAKSDYNIQYTTDVGKAKQGRFCRSPSPFSGFEDPPGLPNFLDPEEVEEWGEAVSSYFDNIFSAVENWAADHWTDNDYGVYAPEAPAGRDWDNSGIGAGTANSGGYEIMISEGCPGQYGQYLEMHIGESEVNYINKTEPEGCEVGVDRPCDNVMNEWGDGVAQIPVITIPGARDVSLDLRGTTPPGSYSGTVPVDGELWFHIKDEEVSTRYPDEPGYYADNIGNYTVTVETTKLDDGFSGAIQDIITPVKGIIFGYCQSVPEADRYDYTEEDCPNTGLLDPNDPNSSYSRGWQDGITKRMYNKLVGETVFLQTVRAALVLYVILYAGAFMVGMVESKQEDFLHRIIKVAIVAVLLSGASWEFFNTYLFTFFYNGVDDFIAIMSSNFTGHAASASIDPVSGESSAVAYNQQSSIFAFADITLVKFFQASTQAKIAGLLFSSPIGILYILLIWVGMILFLHTLIRALIIYLFSMLAISLLLVVAPIFISFLLFDKTKDMFEKWIKNLIHYMLQPVLVFTALAIFNIFVYSSLFAVLQYPVCWETIWMGSFFEIPGTEFPVMNFYVSSGSDGLPMQFFMLLVLLIICSAMYNFVDWMSELASHLVLGHSTGGQFLKGASGSFLKDVGGTAKSAGGYGLKAIKQPFKLLK